MISQLFKIQKVVTMNNKNSKDELKKLIEETIELYDSKVNTKEYLEKRGTTFHTAFGGNYTCLCPIHDEEEPSFSYSEKRDIWTCFGECHTSGKMCKLHYKILEKEKGKTNYIEVLRDLQQMFPMVLPSVDFSINTVKKYKQNHNKQLFQNFLNNQKTGKTPNKTKYTIKEKTAEEFDLNLFLYNEFQN